MCKKELQNCFLLKTIKWNITHDFIFILTYIMCIFSPPLPQPRGVSMKFAPRNLPKSLVNNPNVCAWKGA
jgi:hypothetical protein